MTPRTTARPATTPSTAKGEATRAFLLRTAALVFAERGYAATTLNDLIAASGLTKGAFYFYFRSKSELAVAVLEDQKERWLRRVGAEVLAAGGPTDQLRALVPAMLALLADDPGAWAITRLTAELSSDEEAGPRVRTAGAAWVELVADIVRRGRDAGELRPGADPHDVAVVLVAAFDGLKAMTDALDPGQGTADVFARRARTLQTLVEEALVVDRGARAAPDPSTAP